MDSPFQQSDLITLVLGTSSMLLMLFAIIFLAFLFQRKLIKKQSDFREIEKLLEKQELKSAYLLIEGQDQERKKIASEIHDNIGNLLATLKIFSDLSLQKEQNQELKKLNLKINQIAETVSNEIRKISHSLDTGTVQNFGFKAAIEQLQEAIQTSGKLDLSLHVEMENQLSRETSINLYRIIQEMITNTLKHSKATKARLEITELNSEIIAIYEDNGIGFEPVDSQKSGIGLQNIKSRIDHLEGELKINSTKSGSTFIIEIPTSQIELLS